MIQINTQPRPVTVAKFTTHITNAKVQAHGASSAFRQWHRFKLLGLPIEKVAIGEKALTQKETQILEDWVYSGGAWKCSLMPWPEAHGVLEYVLSVGGFHVPDGPCGGGRWASATALEEFLRDRAKSGQRVFRF